MAPDAVSGVTGAADSGPGAGARKDDWPSLVTAKVEELVSLLRDRTVVPVTKAVRFAIFGLLAMAIAMLLGVLFSVALIRVFDAEVFHQRVWASYLLVAGIFAALGLLLSWWRRPRS